jgi:hypothetical protein
MNDKPRLDKVYEQVIMLDFPNMPPRVEYHKQNAINSIIANLGLTIEEQASIKIISDAKVIENKIHIGIVLAWISPYLCDVGEFLWHPIEDPGTWLETKVFQFNVVQYWRYSKRLLSFPECGTKTPSLYYWERINYCWESERII